MLADIECTYEEGGGDWRFVARFSDGSDRRWHVSERVFIDPPPPSSTLLVQARNLYSRLYEDHQITLRLREQIRGNHQIPAELRRSDAHREGRFLAVGRHAARRDHLSGRAHHRDAAPEAVGVCPWDSYNPFFSDDIGDQDARKKGESLLCEWLSPEQLRQYEKHQYFEVVGSNTGKRYRIRHGWQMNIDELDENGTRTCTWCFLPEGALVAGDVMLAQKIALESFENEALAKANCFPTTTASPRRMTSPDDGPFMRAMLASAAATLAVLLAIAARMLR